MEERIQILTKENDFLAAQLKNVERYGIFNTITVNLNVYVIVIMFM